MIDILPGDILIGSAHGLMDHIRPSGTFVQTISVTDDISSTPSVNGIAIDPTGNSYKALADPDATTDVPHDVAYLPGGGWMLIVQVRPGVAEIWKYDSSPTSPTRTATWSAPTDAGWQTQRMKLDVDAQGKFAYYTDSGRTIFRTDIQAQAPISPPFARLDPGSPYIYGGLKLLPGGGLVVAMTKTGDGPRNAVCLDSDPTMFWTDEVNPTGQYSVFKRRVVDGSAVLSYPVSFNDQITSLACYPKTVTTLTTRAGTA